MNRLNSIFVGLSLSITVAVIFILCALAVVIAPSASLAGLNLVSHGLNLAPLSPSAVPITMTSVLVGLLLVMAISFVTGVVFALVSNVLTKSRNSLRNRFRNLTHKEFVGSTDTTVIKPHSYGLNSAKASNSATRSPHSGYTHSSFLEK